MFTGFSSFKTLISPPTQEWKTQSLYCCTCATLYTQKACVTSLQVPTMSHSISYLKFTGAYVWVCPVGTISAIVEEQETAETGPTKHRQMTRKEWWCVCVRVCGGEGGGDLAHFVFQFQGGWPPRHRGHTYTYRIQYCRGWRLFWEVFLFIYLFEEGQDETAHFSTNCVAYRFFFHDLQIVQYILHQFSVNLNICH